MLTWSKYSPITNFVGPTLGQRGSNVGQRGPNEPCYLGWDTQKLLTVYPDSKVHGANMGPIWGQHDPGGPMSAPWTLLSGYICTTSFHTSNWVLVYYRKHDIKFAFSVISWRWDATDSWKRASWKTSVHVSYILNTRCVGGQATQKARPSAATVFTMFCLSKPVSAPDAFKFQYITMTS